MACLTCMPCLYDYARHALVDHACCTRHRLTMHINTRRSCEQASSAYHPLTNTGP